jgi:glucan phosphoethanolaminetransferase (alkaline phosphatase superfamily)
MWLVVGGAGLGALLLFIGEFTTLFNVNTASSTGAVRSTTTGSHHSYAMLLISLAVAFFVFGVWRTQSRVALLALTVLGLIALLISLFGDLPDAHASGRVIKIGIHYQLANSSASTGIYMDTLGAALILIAAVSALILIGPPRASDKTVSTLTNPG